MTCWKVYIFTIENITRASRVRSHSEQSAQEATFGSSLWTWNNIWLIWNSWAAGFLPGPLSRAKRRLCILISEQSKYVPWRKKQDCHNWFSSLIGRILSWNMLKSSFWANIEQRSEILDFDWFNIAWVRKNLDFTVLSLTAVPHRRPRSNSTHHEILGGFGLGELRTDRAWRGEMHEGRWGGVRC